MQKILLLGLDGAGKTALYQKFFLKKSLNQLKKIPATRGIAKYDHDFLRTDFQIIDAGGGKQFRQSYIGNKELVDGLNAIVFVIDSLDVRKFQEVANFFIIWIKSIANYLKKTKAYMLFHKVDPGTEAKVKLNLQQLAPLIKPINNLYPGELYTSITSIYNDSSNQMFQRILLDLLPRKMTTAKAQERPATTPQPTIAAKTTSTEEAFLTKPVHVPPQKTPTGMKLSQPPTVPSKTSATPTSKPITTPRKAITPPKITGTAEKVVPPKIGKPLTTKARESKKIQEKTAERLSDIIEATLDNNPNFIAIAVYTEQAERVCGAVQQGKDSIILQTIEQTLAKINLEQYMDKLGKIRIGGEGHIKIDEYDIFFEKVSPEHISMVICLGITEDTIKNISQINRYLNQALSVKPEGVSEEAFKRADLMTELKMRLHHRGKSIDEML
ncbi:MAG: hypothetical protein K9W42_03155 [Candidatus Heimdallarchaeota archaeon]|nr:hypothetical protein [Candidatus Heimdallarchaeota archaeon]